MNISYDKSKLESQFFIKKHLSYEHLSNIVSSVRDVLVHSGTSVFATNEGALRDDTEECILTTSS